MSEETAPYGTGAPAQPAPVKRIRTHHLREMKQRGEKITMLTAYDMYTAATFDEAGIDLLLVGDSASNNVLGNETSLPITVDELLPLTRAVAGAARRAMVVGDLPFGSYQASPEQGYLTAVRFMKEAGAHCVKLEGGVEMVPVIEKLTQRRHPGHRPHRLHPPVRARPGRLPGPGPRRDRRAAAPRRARRAGGRRVRGRHGDGARRRRRRDEPRARASPRSASAPATAATARCWSGRTPSACAPAGWRASSSSTPTCTACSSRARAPTPPTSGRHLPRARAHVLSLAGRPAPPYRGAMRRPLLLGLVIAVSGALLDARTRRIGAAACGPVPARSPPSSRVSTTRGTSPRSAAAEYLLTQRDRATVSLLERRRRRCAD